MESAGSSYFLSGSCGVLAKLTDPQQGSSDRMGSAVAVPGDLSGDGSPELATGIPTDDLGAALDAGSVLFSARETDCDGDGVGPFGGDDNDLPCSDLDSDGYGSPGAAGCPAGDLTDCDDSDLAAHPGATETCDAIDNDCDGFTDEALAQSCYTGAAGTLDVGECRGGTSVCVNGSFGPCAGEVTPTLETCDSRDNDCDGSADEDLGTTTCGLGECARTVQNCAGGQTLACLPGDPAPEACNDLDDDCDGATDDGDPGGGAACDAGEPGACADGTTTCQGGSLACIGGAEPAPESCDGFDNDCDGVADEGIIDVLAETHQVGPGSHPGSTRSPLPGLTVGIYDKSSGSCARVTCGGTGHQDYPCIVASCQAEASGTTDLGGEVVFELTPGDYLVIGSDGTDKHLGVSAPDLTCGLTIRKHLRQIVTSNGKVHPAKSTQRTGSVLTVIEPEFLEWSGSAELYPFVFESLGDWTVTTSVEPPEGFVADHDSLTAEVNSSLEAVQFTIEDVGSDWIPTGVQHVVLHGGRRKIVRSRIGVKLAAGLAALKGLDRAGRVLDAAGQSLPERAFDPRQERPAEIVGWIEPSVADPQWVMKVRVNRPGHVTLSVRDASGRVVRLLVSSLLAPGEHSFPWDGRDADGRSLAPEAHHLSLAAGPAIEAVRIIRGGESRARSRKEEQP